MKYFSHFIVAFTVALLIGVVYWNSKVHIEYEAPFEIYRGYDTNVLIKNSIIEQGKADAKQEHTMTSELIMLIVSTTGILLLSLFNYKDIKKEIVNNNNENKEQHSQIFVEIKRAKECGSVETDLREIVAHCVEFAPKGIIRFLHFEGENNIKFCKEVINSKFDYSIIANVKAKIEAYSADAQEESNGLTEGFRKQFLKIQKENTDIAFNALESIVYDDSRNEKVHRFRIAMIRILDKHLHEIIELYINTK